MCFYIHKTNPEKKIAKKDLVSYKILRYYKEHKEYYSTHQHGHQYMVGGHLPTVELGYGVYGQDGKDSVYVHRKAGLRTGDIIEQGYHSFSSIDRALFELRDTNKSVSFRICKFIIPKDSEYYYNPEDGEYVSTAIRFVGHAMPYLPRSVKRFLGGMTTIKPKLY